MYEFSSTKKKDRTGVDREISGVCFISASQCIGFNPIVRYNEYSMSSSTGIYLEEAAAHTAGHTAQIFAKQGGRQGIAQGKPQQGTPQAK